MGQMTNQPTSEFELCAEVNGSRQRLTSLNVGLLLFTPIPFNESARQYRQMFDAYLSMVPKAAFRWRNLGGASKTVQGRHPKRLCEDRLMACSAETIIWMRRLL
jgi:hypothetical protein